MGFKMRPRSLEIDSQNVAFKIGGSAHWNCYEVLIKRIVSAKDNILVLKNSIIFKKNVALFSSLWAVSDRNSIRQFKQNEAFIVSYSLEGNRYSS